MNLITTPVASELTNTMITLLEKEGNPYILDGERVFILRKGKRIEIDPSFKASYAGLQQELVDVGTASWRGRECCQRVLNHARGKATAIVTRHFSAFSADRKRLYLPQRSGQLLRLDSTAIIPAVQNGTNTDSIWLEPAPDQEPFTFNPAVDVKAELERFEELCLNPQSVTRDSHRWFIGMHEGMMPFLRELHTARLIVQHEGPSQQGKTSAAQRFYALHGLGLVEGDVSVSSLQNTKTNNGFLVLDNREQDSYSKPNFRDWLLFASTGAKSGRATNDGGRRPMSSDRPIVALTSIEGVARTELKNRITTVQFELPPTSSSAYRKEYKDNDRILTDITQHRDGMCSALMFACKHFMSITDEWVEERLRKYDAPNPFTNFPGYIRSMSKCLYAFGRLTQRPESWVESIVTDWFASFSSQVAEEDEDALETAIEAYLGMYEALGQSSVQTVQNITLERSVVQVVPNHNHQGTDGKLYVIRGSGELLGALRLNHLAEPGVLPQTSTALGRRLRGLKGQRLHILHEQDAPAVLKRRSDCRPLGIFMPKNRDQATSQPSTSEECHEIYVSDNDPQRNALATA